MRASRMVVDPQVARKGRERQHTIEDLREQLALAESKLRAIDSNISLKDIERLRGAIRNVRNAEHHLDRLANLEI